MPHTTTKNKRTKRPDDRPNGKRRRQEAQAIVEKDRVGRVAANEAKGKIVAVERLEKLPPLLAQEEKEKTDATTGQVLKPEKKPPAEVRVRALHKLLRQIQGLDEKKKGGATLNDAQEIKLARMEGVMAELEELQNVEDSDEEEEEEDDEQ
jgi:uncharacterized protein with WD repeat